MYAFHDFCFYKVTQKDVLSYQMVKKPVGNKRLVCFSVTSDSAPMCNNWCILKSQQFILNIGKESQTIFLHDSKWKSYFASYFSKWCSSIFIDMHLLCLEAWNIFWWHWPVLYAGYSMHLLVIQYIAWIQSLCICTYFIIALIGKCKENQRACCTVW